MKNASLTGDKRNPALLKLLLSDAVLASAGLEPKGEICEQRIISVLIQESVG